MKYWQRGLVILGVVVMSLIILGIIGQNITGEVILDYVKINNCSNSDIADLWDWVFVESSSNIEIFKEFEAGGDCEKYIAYKNDSDGLLILFGVNYNSSWGSSSQFFEGNLILESSNSSFYYINISDSLVEGFKNSGDIESKENFILGLDGIDVIDWSLVDFDDLNNKMNGIYDLSSVSEESWDDITGYFTFSEEMDENLNFSSLDLIVSKDESVAYGDYMSVLYDFSDLILLNKIPDFVFDRNSSWNYAFDLNNYINISNDTSFSFYDIPGGNNTGGEWINYSLNDTEVSFMPAVNFTGTREFRFFISDPIMGDIYSNIFNVTINYPNEAPVLLGEIGPFYVPIGGSVNVFLEVYFNDPDGDVLTYGIRNGDTLDINISEDVMTIKLGANFGDFEKFKVFADDGGKDVKSNEIYIYSGDYVEYEALIGNESNFSVENGNGDGVDIQGGNTTNESSGDYVSDGFFNSTFWIVAFSSLVIIGVVVWFLILRIRDNIVSQPKQELSHSSLVDQYLKKLNLPQKKTMNKRRVFRS